MWSAAYWSAMMSVVIALIVPIIKKILISLGIGALMFPVGTLALDAAKGLVLSYIQQYVTNVTALTAVTGIEGMLGLLKVDTALNVIFSALAVKAAWLLMNRVQLKPVWNPPGNGASGNIFNA